jgi:hypothetical protein
MYLVRMATKTRSGLIKVTINLRARDVAFAKRVARARAVPYQHVVRGWVSDGVERVEARK